MLSRMSQAEAEGILATNADRLAAYKTPLDALTQRIQQARRSGYVHISKAIVRGTSAIALPVCDNVGRPLAAVSTIALTSRQSSRRIPILVSQLQAAADRIAAAVSSRPARNP
jgi:DNA-binding IclR family transcriptional regulator